MEVPIYNPQEEIPILAFLCQPVYTLTGGFKPAGLRFPMTPADIPGEQGTIAVLCTSSGLTRSREVFGLNDPSLASWVSDVMVEADSSMLPVYTFHSGLLERLAFWYSLRYGRPLPKALNTPANLVDKLNHNVILSLPERREFDLLACLSCIEPASRVESITAPTPLADMLGQLRDWLFKDIKIHMNTYDH